MVSLGFNCKCNVCDVCVSALMDLSVTDVLFFYSKFNNKCSTIIVCKRTPLVKIAVM